MAATITETTITYKRFGSNEPETMSLPVKQASNFALRMLRQRAWTEATIAEATENTKLQNVIKSQLPKTHVQATPHLLQLSTHAKKLEAASSKRLVSEQEREKLLMHTLEAMKELGMGGERVHAYVTKVFGIATEPTQYHVSSTPNPVSPPVSDVKAEVPPVPTGNNATAKPVEQPKAAGLFRR